MHHRFPLPVLVLLLLAPSAAGAVDLEDQPRQQVALHVDEPLSAAGAVDLEDQLRQQVALHVDEPLSAAVGERTTRLLEEASRRAMARRSGQEASAPRTTCALDGDGVFVCVVRPDASASAPAARAD